MIKYVPDESIDSYEYALSACLCGECCRYDGASKCIPELKKLYDENRAILVCPEVMGGMPVPRKPCEIKNGRVINRDGEDMTEFYLKGARAALELCRKYNVRKAVLKQNSPSCGSKHIYDGSFSGGLIDGEGIAANLLSENGIEVSGEEK